MARLTETFHYGEQRGTTTIETTGHGAAPEDVARLIRMGDFNTTAAADQTKMLRMAQLLNSYGTAELGWARYTLTR